MSATSSPTRCFRPDPPCVVIVSPTEKTRCTRCGISRPGPGGAGAQERAHGPRDSVELSSVSDSPGQPGGGQRPLASGVAMAFRTWQST